jgi:hypothetical protein
MRKHRISEAGTPGPGAGAGTAGSAADAPAPGDGLVTELKWVHGMIRRDLEIVRRLAEELADGLPGESAAAAIQDLAVGSPGGRTRRSGRSSTSYSRTWTTRRRRSPPRCAPGLAGPAGET